MRVARTVLVVVIGFLLLGVLPAGAQDVVNLTIDNVTLENFPQAKALVTVRNENGVPILDLGPDKFEIVEDGRSSFPPSEVGVQVNPDAVISVVLVIDVSGSMKGKPIKEAMRAANALLDQLGPRDRVAIVAFADQVDLDPSHLEEGKELAFTTDKNAARNVVNFLDTKLGWDTPLYDAMYKGVKMVSSEPVGKRAVIVMTDGKDERDNAQGVPVKDAGSLSTPDDPINEANRHNIPIFPIGLGSGIDNKYLGRVAERTGGRYQKTPQAEELTALFQSVLDQLKQQYVLTYNTTLTEDENYHSLLVRVHLPQGDAFDETKFQFVSSAPPQPAAESTAPAGQATEETGAGTALTPAIVAQANPTSSPAIVVTAEPEPSGIGGIIDTVKNTIQERPLVAVLIGGGLLLLLVLIVALLVVLLRGGKKQEDEDFTTGELPVTYGQTPGWSEGPTSPGTPAVAMAPPAVAMTEVATSDWTGPGAAGPGAAPPAGGEVPVPGGTRIIERGPKHLAMLVDKAHPDRKYDLAATTNIGRSPDNQVVLDDPTVSRNHAWIKVEGEEFLVFDVGSANGTFVNDERVETPTPLENGDVVRFGTVELVFTRVF